MNRIFVGRICCLVLVCMVGSGLVGAAPQTNTGTIKGHIRLSGKAPANPVIRLGADPKCGQLNAGKRLLQEDVVASADGGLANAFVKLQGTFPKSPVPAQPVTLDQKGCVYIPRVLGARVGQELQIRNSDAVLHEVHSISVATNKFMVGQPTAGLVYKFKLKDEETMLRLKCDIHSWMNAWVGVVSHPYFAVSGPGGTFEIDNVPAGTHTIEVWHEVYGPLKQTVKVTAGGTATVELIYKGTEKGTEARGAH